MEVLLLEQTDIKIKKIGKQLQGNSESIKKSNYMKKYFENNIFGQSSFGDALSHIIAVKVSSPDFELRHLIQILRKQLVIFIYL